MTPTRQDVVELTARVQMDVNEALKRVDAPELHAACAKLVELRAWLVDAFGPVEPAKFDPDKALRFVERVGWDYTDSSLSAELHAMGATREFIDRALIRAAEVRRTREGVPAEQSAKK